MNLWVTDLQALPCRVCVFRRWYKLLPVVIWPVAESGRQRGWTGSKIDCSWLHLQVDTTCKVHLCFEKSNMQVTIAVLSRAAYCQWVCCVISGQKLHRNLETEPQSSPVDLPRARVSHHNDCNPKSYWLFYCSL